MRFAKPPGEALGKASNSMIQRMRELGLDTTWYHKMPQEGTDTPDECSRFSLYVLDRDYSYTVQSTGKNYLIWRKLKEPAVKREYFCSGCKQRWGDWQQTLKHLDKGE